MLIEYHHLVIKWVWWMKWFGHKNSCWTNPNNFSRQKKASRGGPTGEDNPLDAWKCRQQTWSFRRKWAWSVLVVGSLWGTSDVIGLLVSNGGVLAVSYCAHSHLVWPSWWLSSTFPQGETCAKVNVFLHFTIRWYYHLKYDEILAIIWFCTTSQRAKPAAVRASTWCL